MYTYSSLCLFILLKFNKVIYFMCHIGLYQKSVFKVICHEDTMHVTPNSIVSKYFYMYFVILYSNYEGLI